MLHKLLTSFAIAFLFVLFLATVGLKDVRGESGAVTDLIAVALTNEPTAILYWTYPGDVSVVKGYEVGYFTSPITEENWNQVTKMSGVMYENVGYLRIQNLNLSTHYYFAVKVYDSSNIYGNLSNVISITTTDSVKNWNPSSFDEMINDSWWNLNPSLPPGSTSQVFLGYDPERDMLMTWGGHLFGGGFPQVDEIYTYNTGNLAQENTWKIEDINLSEASDKPLGGCTTGGTYDPVNKLMFKRGQALTKTYEYFRKFNFENWPWVYDFSRHMWFDMKTFNYGAGYNDGYNGSGVTYDADDQIIVIVDPRQEIQYRTIIYDIYANKVTPISVVTWRDMGETRDEMGLVYDTKRHRFVVVGGSWGYGNGYNNVYTFNMKDKIWTKEEGVSNYGILPTQKILAADAAYDSLHDKIILFELSIMGAGELFPSSRVVLTFVYDPETKTWSRENDKPGYGSSHRAMDLNTIFSKKHNAALVLDSGGGSQPTKTWAYRYSSTIPPQTKPNPPQNPSLETTSTNVILNWQASDSPGVLNYNIYRGQAENPWEANYSKIAIISSSTLSYTDTTALSGKIYFYYITATDSSDESEASLKVRSQPRVVREGYVAVLSENQTKIKWTPRDEDKDVAGYNVYRAEANIAIYPVNQNLNTFGELTQYTRPTIKNTGSPAESSYVKLNSSLLTNNEYTDNNINLSNPSATYPYKVYAYRIKALNKFGVESGWSPYWLTIPNPPTGLKVSQDTNNFFLSWIAPQSGEGVKGYKIYVAYNDTGVKDITDSLTSDVIINQTSVIIPKSIGLGTYQRFYVTARDNLDQDGAPSAGAWGNRPYWNLYKQYYEFGITTSFLPDAVPGQGYNIRLQVVNGISPFRWQIVSGSLPSGLTLSSDGKISGTPGQAGTYTFMVKVTDSSMPAHTATKGLCLRVETIAIPPTAKANGPYEGQVGTPLTFNAGGSYDADGTIVSYEWDVNDDDIWVSADSGVATHTWSVPYGGNIRLRVTDNDGLTATDTTSVVVLAPPLKGDLDGDGDIDLSDYQAFRSALGKCKGQQGYNPDADYDGDGCVTYADYRIWYGYYKSQK